MSQKNETTVPTKKAGEYSAEEVLRLGFKLNAIGNYLLAMSPAELNDCEFWGVGETISIIGGKLAKYAEDLGAGRPY